MQQTPATTTSAPALTARRAARVLFSSLRLEVVGGPYDLVAIVRPALVLLMLLVLSLSLACSAEEPRAPDATAQPTVHLPSTTAPGGGGGSTPPAVTSSPVAAAINDYDPARFNYSTQVVGSGFVQPDFVTYARDGTNRLFVLEKIGRIRLLDGTMFLDISDRVLSPPVDNYDREQGMLGLAFHPNFATNGFFYVHYNDRSGVHVISRLRTGPNGLGDPASEKVLMRQPQPETNFNGGMLEFGPDGYLYAGFGTGGTERRLQDNATDLGTVLGKILRIDVDSGDPYGIPADNPFRTRAGARPEIWAIGLRNPWRFPSTRRRVTSTSAARGSTDATGSTFARRVRQSVRTSAGQFSRAACATKPRPVIAQGCRCR